VFVDVLLPGSLTLYGANGTFHTALVAEDMLLEPDPVVRVLL
jgi:hypothetical protein